MKTALVLLVTLLSYSVLLGQNIVIKNNSSVAVHCWLPSADSGRYIELLSEEEKSFCLKKFDYSEKPKQAISGFFCRFRFDDEKNNCCIFYKILQLGDVFIISDETLKNFSSFIRPSLNGWPIKNGVLERKNEHNNREQGYVFKKRS